MLRTQPILYLARIVVETVSPLSLGTGRGSALFDVQVVTDANGLPAIPGTSLAGVLRHAMSVRLKSEGDPAMLNKLFGFADGDKGDPSAFTVTWGHIHTSADQPVDGPDLEHAWTRDAILKSFDRAALPHRDHVRLDHRGTVAERGKFDRNFVPAGYRFTFEMALADDEHASLASYWTLLKALLTSPGFRLGGATRRGYGQLKVVRLAARRFDLRKSTDFEAYRAHPCWLDQECDLRPESSVTVASPEWLNLELELQPEDFWRFGGGSLPRTQGKTADALPYTEERVVWGQEGPVLARHLVVPASGVKGALAHRVAYHYNRLIGRFADQASGPEDEVFQTEKNPAVRVLFGYAKDRQGNGAKDGEIDTGQAGAVLIDDVALAAPSLVARLAHNSIDRFTGGVRDGVLFTEEAVYGGAFRLKLQIGKSAWKNSDDKTKQAFRAAVDDLIDGRLSLGAAAAKGHGGFTGRVIHTDLEEFTL
jgi:CRISPR/Cas system CSM-associated protein Csm3 (group 7 of RAMP superfamily)